MIIYNNKLEYKLLFNLITIDVKTKKQLLKNIDFYVNKNLFYSEEQKEEINKIITSSLKLNRILKKCITNFRKKKILSKESINNTTLLCEPIQDIDNKVTIIHKQNKFIFSLQELVHIIYNNLLNFEDLLPEPTSPKNPYNNVDFNVFELNYIINSAKKEYLKKNKKFPLILTLFENSQYDIDTLCENHYFYLTKTAIQNHIQTISTCEWDNIFDEFIDTYNLKQKFCIKCLKRIDNFQNIFKKVIEYYICESNDLIDVPKSYRLFKKYCEEYDLKRDFRKNKNCPNCYKNRTYYIRKKKKENPFYSTAFHNMYIHDSSKPFIFRANTEFYSPSQSES